MLRFISRAPALLVAATCVVGASPAPATPFAPTFFVGRSEGEGVVTAPFARRPFHVVSDGRMQADGWLVVDQTVTEQGKAPHRREWRIRETAPGRYQGTLTDAASPVAGEQVGDRLRLRFRMHGGLAAEQWLGFAPGETSVLNLIKVKKFGIVVARIHETIRPIR